MPIQSPIEFYPGDKRCSVDDQCPTPAIGTVRWKPIRGAGETVTDTPCWEHLQDLRADKREARIISEEEFS